MQNFFSSYFFLIIALRHIIFSLLNTFMRKGKDPDPYLWPMDPYPEGPKTCGSPTFTKTELFDRKGGRMQRAK
jgi:hypothetical protein